MSEKRYAVLIASSEYQDTNLQNLRYPENDVDGLNEVLSSEKYGNFSETFILKNRPSNEVLKKVNQVIKRAGKDDLVLIYFSGHGKLNRAGKLHLATTDTEVELLEATSIPLETIRSFIDVSASNKVAIILDSCFSGAAGAAFAKGEVDDQLQLASGGRGTYLMTSATGVQTALEKEGDQYGVFTKHIIEGIRSGEADRDDDSLITMDELYSYVHDHVLEESHQEPTKYNLNVRGDLVIARSGKSKREERAREIRKMLFEQAEKGYLPDSILSKSLKIIASKPAQLSEIERKYDDLLDQLLQKYLEMGRFIDEWNKVEQEYPVSQISEVKKEERVEESRDKALEKILPASKEFVGDFRIWGMEPEKGRWLFVIIGIIINLCLGSIYSWSVFKAPLKYYFETLGPEVSASALQLPFMIFLAFFAISMPLAGGYIEKKGPGKVALIGGALAGLGWLLASMSTSINMMVVTYGIVGGIGVGIAYGVPVAVSGRWFPDRRGLAVGLTVLGFGFSAFFTANIAHVLISSSGVMATFRIFGIAFIILMVVLAKPLVFPPFGWKPSGWEPPEVKLGAEKKCEFKRQEMLKTKAFVGLWVCYFIGCLAGLMAISISANVAAEVGSDAVAALLLGFSPVGFFSIFNGGGRPIFGILTDKLTPKNTAILSFALIIIASWMILQMQTVPVYIVSFAILWGCLGGWLAIAPAATASFFGVGDYPRCYGVVFLAYGAGALVGPYMAGWLKDATGSYIAVFPYVILFALMGIIIASIMMKHPVAKE